MEDMEDIPKSYNPKETEEKIYKLWEKSGFFNPDNLPVDRPFNKVQGKPFDKIQGRPFDKVQGRQETFVAAIAPPNITGELHMGHALENIMEDIIFRMKRMQGYKTLWLPGTDHAGIAAQNAVEKQLAKEGLSRHRLGREKFLERMWQWREKYGGAILNQFKKLGLSLDWSRTKFTLDPAYQKAVETAFIHYYEKGWIYRGERVVNWCVRCATSISDLEVNYIPEKSKLYFIKYGPFALATVRPETKLGDTALAVHPSDERYKKYIGQELEIESVDNTVPKEEKPKIKKIKIKVVGDIAVDPEFGTGIIKVTPAHDIADSEIARRNNLPSIKIIDERGKMNENAGIRYTGMKTTEAREQIAEDLEKLGLMEKIEDYEHNIARCDRCNSVIEPLPSEQWFLKMEELAKLALDALRDKKITFNPARWNAPYENWLKNIRDWNISRQLWWGHRLPVWFHEPKCVPRQNFSSKNLDEQANQFEKCENIIVSAKKPKCEYCDARYIQSEDVLDTWFSSALWPFAVMGWPEKTKDLAEYYPTHFITSARDILFLWIVRMIFSGLEFTGQVPFKDIYIHPTVLTKDGRRMSKSLGTGINPLDLTEKYGTDALRFGLAYQTAELQDIRFNEDVIMMGKKFANKLWNIARYAITKANGQWLMADGSKPRAEIVEKLNKVALDVTGNIENYRFGEAAHLLYDFVWHDFADKYLEETKDKEDDETKETLLYILADCLKLLHPFMPFITEEIYSKLPLKNKKLLLVESWPE